MISKSLSLNNNRFLVFPLLSLIKLIPAANIIGIFNTTVKRPNFILLVISSDSLGINVLKQQRQKKYRTHKRARPICFKILHSIL